MKFRYDINALRALAVTAVTLYHYKVNFISGGYVGVDIFFVISGYLMTNIIVGRLQESSFTIQGFYYDRTKRIIPGLVGLCFGLLAAGFFFLDPVTYHYLGSTSISALLFFSNFRFWEATGYFDAQSSAKWLLHTWSLSVEWQFYLIYPILLMYLHKFQITRRYLAHALWAMALLSFALCVWFTEAEPASAFYLLPQRAWEMLAGGIVALQFKNPEQKYSRILLAGGLLFIAISIFTYTKNMPWPYYWALTPVVGTCLVIAANRADAAVFKYRPIQTVGIWSYSTYLWHWPIAVAALYFNFVTTTPYKIACEILILAAIISGGGLALSWLQKLLKEKRIDWKPARPRLALIAGSLALTVGLAGAVTLNDGFQSRRPDGDKQVETYRTAITDWDYPPGCNGRDQLGNVKPCHLGRPDRSGVLFIGDSYAMQIFSRFAERARFNPEDSYTFVTNPACPPIVGIRMNFDRFHCNGFVDKALDFADSRDFKRIVLVANWYSYFNPIDNHVCFREGDACVSGQDPSWYRQHLEGALAATRARLLQLQKRGAEIAFVSSTPYGRWDVPMELLKRRFLGMDTAEIAYVDRDKFEAASGPLKSLLISMATSIGAKFIDPLDFLCDGRLCPTIDENGLSYFQDTGHLRASTVRTKRFHYLDDAAGATNQYSAMPVAGIGN
ncbi:acyltransferase family protein [Methylocapsa aurea]|uniref:acyltransferase family protein n=1 Tax=Methylocapsa aurea TaxID=663610 RepID=UPI00138E335F|nr:acyltransferase family protein [Methylocapsa aurea]